MKKRWIGIGLVALAAMAFAQQKIVFADKGGSMQVSGFSSWSTRRLDQNRLSFLGLGNPVVASWSSQGITVRSKRVEGTVERGGASGYSLVTGQMSGGVVSNIVRPSSSGKGNQTIQVNSDSASFMAKESLLHLAGSVHVVGDDPGGGQSYDLKGASADITLSEANGGGGKAPIDAMKKVVVAGPVSFKFARKAANGLDLNGTAGKLVFDGVAGTIELIGAVRLKGDDPQFGAEASADRALITLDASRNPISVELTGQPTSSTVKEKAGANR